MIESQFIIYSKEGSECPWCQKAIDVLDNLGLSYIVKPLKLYQLKEVAKRAKMTTVPIIYHGALLIGGHKELIEYIEDMTALGEDPNV